MHHLNDSLKAIDMICEQMNYLYECKKFRDFIELNVSTIKSKYSNVISIGNRVTRNIGIAIVTIINTLTILFNSYNLTKQLVELVKIDSLEQTFATLSQTLEKEQKFANEPSRNVLNIIESSPKIASFANEILSIHVKISITEKETTLYKAHKVPIKRGKEMLSIKNISPFMTINTNEQGYDLSQDDLDNCINVHDIRGTQMCQKSTDKYRTGCTNEIFQRNTTHYCQLEKIISQNYFIHMKKNTFYCTIINFIEVNFQTVEGELYHLNLTTSGFLTIKGDGVLSILNETISIDSDCEKISCEQIIEFKLPHLDMSSLNESNNYIQNNPSPIIVDSFEHQFHKINDPVPDVYFEKTEQSSSSYYYWLYFIIILNIIAIYFICNYVVTCSWQ